MKIAFFLAQFPDLTETFILNQINGLLDRGHDLDIITTAGRRPNMLHPSAVRYDLASRVVSARMPDRILPRSISGGLLILDNVLGKRWALLRALNVVRYGRDALSLRLIHQASALRQAPPYDIIHCHFGESGLRAQRLRELGVLKGKLVTTFYGYDISSYISEHGEEAYRRLFAQGDLCIGITDLMRRQLIGYGCLPERVLHLPLGIDVSAFRFRSNVRRSDEPIRILSVGRLVEKKGYETAIRAVALVAKKYPEVRYDIIGEGPLRGRIQRLIDSLGITHCVRLLGPMDEEAVRTYYESSHLFLLASETASNGDQEGLPQVIVEAQAVGLPVVSTRHSGIPEGVLDGESAFLVEPGNAGAIAGRLEFLIDHPETWQSMGAAGRAFVEANYDAERSMDRLLAAYRQLLD